MAKKTLLQQAFDLISDESLLDSDLLDKVDELYEQADEFDQLMFEAVYEAMIVAGRHPEHN